MAECKVRFLATESLKAPTYAGNVGSTMHNDAFVWIWIAIGVLALVAALLHEYHRKGRAPGTKGYIWGFLVGYSAIVFGAFALIGGVLLLGEATRNPEELVTSMFGLLWGGAFLASGIGILRRRKWAWITRICLWPNILTLVINIIYYRNRRGEFEAEATTRGAARLQAETPTEDQPQASLIAPPPSKTPGKLGLVALALASVGAVAMLVMTIASVYMLASDPAALSEGKPETAVLGLFVLLSGVAVAAAVALGIASLAKKEQQRWPAVAALATSAAVIVLFAAGILMEDAPTEQAASSITTGTGFFVTDNGYLVTCRHVIENGEKLSVLTADGALPAELVAVHKLMDLAILKVDSSVDCLPINKSANLELGARVATLGYPNVDIQGFEPKFAMGHVAALSGPQDDPAYMQLGMTIAPGYSGAAVIDDDGSAVGVATMILNEEVAGNVAYAIKGELVFLFLVDTARKLGLTDLNAPRPGNANQAVGIEQVKAATVLVVADAER
jgi:S1-C subfamily serine protease